MATTLYSTANPPPAGAVRNVLGPDWYENVSRIDVSGSGLSRRIQADSTEVEAAVAQIVSGYERWKVRFRRFADSAAIELLLSDFSSERMNGLVNGMLGEGLGLATYYLGALAERESLHTRPSQWRPLVESAREVAVQVRELLLIFQNLASVHVPEHSDVITTPEDRDQASVREVAIRSLQAVETLCNHLDRTGVDTQRIQDVCGRTDFSQVLMAAEDGARWIEAQGGVAYRQAQNNAVQAEVIALDRGTVALLDQVKISLDNDRKALGLMPLQRRDQVIHEILRNHEALKVPYYPSPYQEGRYSASANTRSHVEQDLQAVATEGDLSFRTLKNWIDNGTTVASWAAKPMAQAWKASRRVATTHFRYDLVEVTSQSLRGGTKGYKFVMSGHQQPPQKGTLSPAQVESLLGRSGREVLSEATEPRQIQDLATLSKQAAFFIEKAPAPAAQVEAPPKAPPKTKAKATPAPKANPKAKAKPVKRK